MLSYKTQIKFNNEAREKILKGVEIIYQAVSTTLGPRGANVAISKATPNGEIYARDIVHDGVSVANNVELPDEFENQGAQILKESAQKTVDAVGDGTTLTIVLAHAILTECHKIIATGTNPMILRQGLEQARDNLLIELEKAATPIKTLEEEIHIATISAEDPELGQMIGEILHEMGIDGVVSVEVSKSAETKVKKETGMQLDEGYLHPLFVTNPEKREAVIENPYLLITDKEINILSDFALLLEEIRKAGRGLVIISPSIGGEALPLLLQNKLAGAFSCLAIKAPSFGQNQKNILQDLSILTGATYITADAGHNFEDVTIEDLGRCEYVKSTPHETVIVGGQGDKAEVEQRVKEIKKSFQEEESAFEKRKIQERLGKMTNGIAAIYVGGTTEIEMKERKERVDDAVHATRAAMEKGIVPGGEILWLRVREILGNSLTDKIMYQALEKPFNKLVENAGQDSGAIRVQLGNQWQNITDENIGFDVIDLTFKDFIESGIVDPLKVLQEALKNSVSVAIQLMTTGASIVPIKDEMPKLPNR